MEEEKSAVTQSSQTRWVQSAENRGRGERSRLMEIDVAQSRDALWKKREVQAGLAGFFFTAGEFSAQKVSVQFSGKQWRV